MSRVTIEVSVLIIYLSSAKIKKDVYGLELKKDLISLTGKKNPLLAMLIKLETPIV